MFMARGLRKGEQDLDEDEFLNVVEVPLEELVEQVLDGTIKDGKTQVALLKPEVPSFYTKDYVGAGISISS